VSEAPSSTRERLAARAGEIAVVGLGKSGSAVSELLARHGQRVYASDAVNTPAVAEQAAALRGERIAVDAGSHDLARIGTASLVVASPGVPPHAPPLAAARERGVPIVSEIEIALAYLPSLRYIAITGTNGKTTTTAIVGHLLRALGHDAPDAGNIGTPLSALALRDHPPPWTALELSSFQLHDTPGVQPTVGVVTNLSPDHLDRYSSVDEYYEDKARLFRNARARSRWVLNADDAATLALPQRLVGAEWSGGPLPGARHLFSSAGALDADACYARDRGELVVLGRTLMRRDEFGLFGDHNVANALAAALAVMVADDRHRTPAARARIAEGLREFRALGHRLEPVGTFGGVEWVNDSKATNVSSTLVAVQGMMRPTILLLGGRHKGEPYTALIEPLTRVGKMVLAYGEAAPQIEHDLKGRVPLERLGSSFDEVIARARVLAAPGDVVLLSPACSSYDMFRNYEERGAVFRTLAAQGAGPK
jgi:UDP-N-acetylmuramoylalanine--D-glutamate ligase